MQTFFYSIRIGKLKHWDAECMQLSLDYEYICIILRSPIINCVEEEKPDLLSVGSGEFLSEGAYGAL